MDREITDLIYYRTVKEKSAEVELAVNRMYRAVSAFLYFKKFSFSITGITVSPPYINSNRKRIPSVNPRIVNLRAKRVVKRGEAPLKEIFFEIF